MVKPSMSDQERELIQKSVGGSYTVTKNHEELRLRKRDRFMK